MPTPESFGVTVFLGTTTLASLAWAPVVQANRDDIFDLHHPVDDFFCAIAGTTKLENKQPLRNQEASIGPRQLFRLCPTRSCSGDTLKV